MLLHNWLGSGSTRYVKQLILLAAVTMALPVSADVVTLTDGRQFEGRVASEAGDALRFETVIAGIKASLDLKRSDVGSLEKKPLPEGFFESAEPGSEPSDAGAAAKAPVLYIEIPIVGRIKENVFAQGIRSAMARAKLDGISHIVFTVDSTGGAVDEAGTIYRTMKQFSSQLTYHVLIKECLGEAIVFPFLADTVHLLPGARVGGSAQSLQNVPARFAKKDEDVVRQQIADDLQKEARNRGRKGDIIRAIVDPAETLAAWRDADEQIRMERTLPGDVPQDRVIFNDGPDSVLVLSFDQATALGVPSITGGPADLGALIGFNNWKEAGGFGRDSMNKTLAARQANAAGKQGKFENDVSRNIQMRETTGRAIESNLRQAASWNPTDASYKSFSSYYRSDWYSGAAWEVQTWTPESQRRWRDRTDASAYYLGRAADGIRAMIRLEKEAVTLGLSRTVKEDKLQMMLDDVTVKQEMLQRNRNRAGE